MVYKGPKITGRSGFGTQYDSRKETTPNFGFGSSNRDAVKKQHLSAEHAKVTPPTFTPGAVYDIQGSIGKQALSQCESVAEYSFGSQARLPKAKESYVTAPGPGTYKNVSSLGEQVDSVKSTSAKYGFGTGQRDVKQYLSADHAKSEYGKDTPGPAAYDNKSSIAKQVLSVNETAPEFKLGTQKRFEYTHVKIAKGIPGAGAYNSTSAVGSQVQSQKTSKPQFSMGTSKRDQRSKMYISPDHEKSLFGVNSPGPTTGISASSMGKQVMSKKSSGPQYGMGTAKRFPNWGKSSGTPGPGAYD